MKNIFPIPWDSSYWGLTALELPNFEDGGGKIRRKVKRCPQFFALAHPVRSLASTQREFGFLVTLMIQHIRTIILVNLDYWMLLKIEIECGRNLNLHCPVQVFWYTQNLTNCLDARTQNIDQVHWIKTAAILKPNENVGKRLFRLFLRDWGQGD